MSGSHCGADSQFSPWKRVCISPAGGRKVGGSSTSLRARKELVYAFCTECNVNISVAGGGLQKIKRHCDMAKLQLHSFIYKIKGNLLK